MTDLRKSQVSRGERHRRTQLGRLKMEQTLGSRDVGAPPLISTILWTCSGYSWARKVQKDTLDSQSRSRLQDGRV